ncbi:T3SS (YopN, CesT) and YbjN peptide-binding chaperone 1 [Parenemella sanctibonifatiensis]|uniref:YbjN domain-containing protein n=1 Tax=Parenemella sanctibonifatiensis TaxID=2016505 RepID=A0A255ECK8_9ACTN|nr:hypothetical protein [Parenemella sanctibonifatiensis]OYN89294.1 hypothetical protein CGZ92_02965 [Parenemella sanctibonifatiensis]
MADYVDFDLDRSTAQAWDGFAERLAEVVSVIDDGSLTIGSMALDADPAPYVRFTDIGQGDLMAEAASNAALGEAYQLDAADLVGMEKLGWHSPTSVGDRPTPDFWVVEPQLDSERLAGLAVATLRDIYGIQHPVFLAPDQLAEVLTPSNTDEPEPGSALAVADFDATDMVAIMPTSKHHLSEMIAEELTEMFGHVPLADAEGDYAIRVGSTIVFLRPVADHREVLVFAPVVHEVEGRSRAVEVLNDLNAEARFVKFQMLRDRVFVTLSVLAHPFVPAHLHQAVRVISEVADGIDEELAAKLRGRTTFDVEHGE